MDAVQTEAARRYPDPFLSHDPSRTAFIAGAEWARKAALEEAAESFLSKMVRNRLLDLASGRPEEV